MLFEFDPLIYVKYTSNIRKCIAIKSIHYTTISYLSGKLRKFHSHCSHFNKTKRVILYKARGLVLL